MMLPHSITCHDPTYDLPSIDLSADITGEAIPNVTPGEVLRKEFMAPLSLSARALARDLGVPVSRITAIMHGTRAITADTAILLASRLGTSPELWMHLQAAHDLEAARNGRSMAPA